MRTNLVFILFVGVIATAIQAYPKVSVSFRAVGTIYIQESGQSVASNQIAFEENYDHGTRRSAITTIEAGINSTVLEYHLERKAFLFSGKKLCTSLNTTDLKFETDIRVVRTDKSGQYVLPIHQLLTLNTSYLASPDAVKVKVGDLERNRWTFHIKDKDAELVIEADWSLPAANTPSAYREVPLSFQIRRSIRNQVTGAMESINQTVSVDLFLHGEVNRKVFMPRRGVYCPTLREPNVFPEIVIKKLKSLRTKVEQVVKDFSSVGVVDTCFDPGSELYKINFSPIKQRVQKGVQRIVSHVQGVVYEMAESRKCVVKSVKEAKKNFDPETIFNPFDKKDFSMEGFFGVGKTVYNSIGETIERGIPCNLYQGIRSDWPPEIEEGNVVSLWEWCLAKEVRPNVEFELNGLPLISLNIYIRESPYSKAESFYYKGLQLAYNFYDIGKSNEEYLDNLAYDIRQCFDDSNQRMLEFRAKILDKVTKELLERNDRHQEHVAKWTEAIVKAAKLRAASLRVADVQTTISKDELDLEVRFVLLGRHPSLPAEVEEIPLEQALDNVKTALDNEQLEVSLDLGTKEDTKTVNLKAEPGTLKRKIVEDEDTSGSKGSYSVSVGAMAGVAVVMLAVGAAIGAAVIFARKRRMYQRV